MTTKAAPAAQKQTRRKWAPSRDTVRVQGPALCCNLMLAALLAIPIRHEMWMRWMI